MNSIFETTWYEVIFTPSNIMIAVLTVLLIWEKWGQRTKDEAIARGISPELFEQMVTGMVGMVDKLVNSQRAAILASPGKMDDQLLAMYDATRIKPVEPGSGVDSQFGAEVEGILAQGVAAEGRPKDWASQQQAISREAVEKAQAEYDRRRQPKAQATTPPPVSRRKNEP